MTDWTSLRYAVVDVEGNGQQPPDLVEVAVVPIACGMIGEPRSWLVKPERSITYQATRVHGLTSQDVADAPSPAEVERDMREALDADALVAHNAHVDVRVLGRQLSGWSCPEVFDTLKLARRLMPNQTSYKLGALTRALALDVGMPAGLSPHRAAYDALVTARLLMRPARHDDGSPRTIAELRGPRPEGGREGAQPLF